MSNFYGDEELVTPTTFIHNQEMSTMSNDTATATTFYANGEEMHQIWNPVFIIFAYTIALVSSYSAVHLLDHGLWRSEEVKKAAIIKHPDILAAVLLGFGAVWSMHFVGMSAVTLEGAPICFNWGITMGSLGAVVVLMILGIKVAGCDIFASPDREKILMETLGSKYMSDSEAVWAVTRITYFHKLHFLFIGSFLAAAGAVVMHYTGMMAQRGPFRKEWNAGYVAASVVAGVVICFAGFWIMFRLRWKIQQLWLRYVSAGIIALAICGLHFFGMLGVTYYADNDAENMCQTTWDENSVSPSGWTYHQIIIMALGILMPTVAVLVQNIINQELILAYSVAARSSVMVSSLFPEQFRDQLFADDKAKLRKFLKSDSETSGPDDELVWMQQSKPIADLFTDTTIMFADVAGFTAWSSEREPSQVFMLLESIYGQYDVIMKKHGVFKVETVGDCYVAVCGLPDKREDHAVVMAKVARECVYKMGILTKKLEVALGPDTGDLRIRIGLHSGPVTAGVLRGDRARFQLFGDTMNLASRMETTGSPGKVQMSAATKDLLIAAGKELWTIPRESEVFVKGKGDMKTFWLNTKDASNSMGSGSVHSASNSESDEYYHLSSDKTQRLIDWNVDLLKGILKEVVARRNVIKNKGKNHGVVNENKIKPAKGEMVLDEVCDIIELPEFNDKLLKKQEDPESIVLPNAVVDQLDDFVSCLAELYHENPFHNFEHASHVVMSVNKLLSRIVAHSSDINVGCVNSSVASRLHDHTYGITSDPLTHFACILSALIHDLDHQGVPNSQLIKENTTVASIYNNKSIAEQNSVDIAWKLFMEDKFKDLRATIYGSEAEMQRFRQLVVNSVMATDIMDKDLKTLRNIRWDKAFKKGDTVGADDADEEDRTVINRKATIVIEHLIQASDVAHTMQHWHVYRKWNQKLFAEMYKAYKEGRAEKNPAEFWYQGEIGFFDFYIIPLAKKLKDCGVFGVASDEYLSYAQANRDEWASRGDAISKQMAEDVKKIWKEVDAKVEVEA